MLRGLEWLLAWSARRGRPLPAGLAAEALRDCGVRDFTAETKTRLWDGAAWQRPLPATRFPLLDAARAAAPAILAERREAVAFACGRRAGDPPRALLLEGSNAMDFGMH